MTDSALSLLGLALRGGNLAVGEEPVAEACKNRRAALILTAADAAQNSVDRVRRWADSGGIPWTRAPWGKEALGAALGRGSCAMAALTDRGLAGALAKKLSLADSGPRPGPEPLPDEKKKSRAVKKPAPRES